MGEKKLINWNYGLADKFFSSKGFFLFDKKDDNEKFFTKQKVSFVDFEGYIYFCSHNNLLRNIPRKFDTSNPHTIQNIKLWCKLNNKPFELVSEKYEGNAVKLNWKCLKENCEEIFKSSWNEIVTNHGCPFCVGQQVGLSNCLATLRPDLAAEWHLTKNGDLTPYDVTANCNKSVWWLCGKNTEHQWQTAICNRNGLNSGCPYCSGDLPSKDYNLLFNNPQLCKEWDYNKNLYNPDEYTPCSNQFAWWICKECGNSWRAKINDRNGIQKEGCPNCNNYKGEIKIRDFLNNNLIPFIPQKRFAILKGIGGKPLSYDFYLPNFNLIIEYQGIQHNKITNFGGRDDDFATRQFQIQQEHDKRKREYAKQNNYNLLEVWYYDSNRIEEILSEVLRIQNKQQLVNE